MSNNNTIDCFCFFHGFCHHFFTLNTFSIIRKSLYNIKSIIFFKINKLLSF